MRTFAAVTTCHGKGWNRYGRTMVETFDRHWPREVTLDLYAEGFEPDLQSDRVIVRDLLVESPELAAFKQRHADNLASHGSGNQPRWHVRVDWRKLKIRIKRKTTLGYRWDAVRFSHKVFAIFEAARHCPADVLFWLDADIRFFADIPVGFLEELMPPECMVSFLRRPKFSECGFVGYNLRHPAIRDFLSEFEALYTTDSLFKERQWHDSYLFDVVKRRFEKQGHKTHDIAQGLGAQVGHIFVNSKLGRYMDHKKGERKTVGASYTSDLKVSRDQTYRSGGACSYPTETDGETR